MGNTDIVEEEVPAHDDQDIEDLDLGFAGDIIRDCYEPDVNLPGRPELSQRGAPVKIQLNIFKIISYPTEPLYMNTLFIGDGTLKQDVIEQVLGSKGFQLGLGNRIWDGNRAVWGRNPVEHHQFNVELNRPMGKGKSGSKPTKKTVLVRMGEMKRVRFDKVEAFVNRKEVLDGDVFAALYALDNLLCRAHSDTGTRIKGTFFGNGCERRSLGSGIEVVAGLKQFLCIVDGPSGATIAVKADVEYGTLFKGGPLIQLIVELSGLNDEDALGVPLNAHVIMEAAKKLKGLAVTARENNQAHADKYMVEEILFGTSARDRQFQLTGPNGEEITMLEWYRSRDVHLVYPDLPLVKLIKGRTSVVPMELVTVDYGQHYPFRQHVGNDQSCPSILNEEQRKIMDAFALPPPNERVQAISKSMQTMCWVAEPDKLMSGLRVDTNASKAEGRFLLAPKVMYWDGKEVVPDSGSWVIKSNRFFLPSSNMLMSWSIVVARCLENAGKVPAAIETFRTELLKIYVRHGGHVSTKQPPTILAKGDAAEDLVKSGWNGAGNHAQKRPQLLVVIVVDDEQAAKDRIRAEAECKYGVHVECITWAQVVKGDSDFMLRVCMRIHAKLGGTNCRASSPLTGVNGHFNTPTAIIGATIYRPTPGHPGASVVSMTLSMDKFGARYAASCMHINYGGDTIGEDAIFEMLKPLLATWKVWNHCKGPEQILYLRESPHGSKWKHIVKQEVPAMKKLVRVNGLDCKFVVAVTNRDHGVRFFSEKTNRIGNPVPGTMVENGVTAPHKHEFYLCSHDETQGTASPVHYHVILNEPGIRSDKFCAVLHEQCYNTADGTSTLPVHPAVHYAGLAARRAIHHYDAASPSGATTPKLRPIGREGGFGTSMWFL